MAVLPCGTYRNSIIYYICLHTKPQILFRRFFKLAFKFTTKSFFVLCFLVVLVCIDIYWLEIILFISVFLQIMGSHAAI